MEWTPITPSSDLDHIERPYPSIGLRRDRREPQSRVERMDGIVDELVSHLKDVYAG